MGKCERCGEKSAEFEIMDDDAEFGAMMVCKDCHPDYRDEDFAQAKDDEILITARESK